MSAVIVTTRDVTVELAPGVVVVLRPLTMGEQTRALAEAPGESRWLAHGRAVRARLAALDRTNVYAITRALVELDDLDQRALERLEAYETEADKRLAAAVVRLWNGEEVGDLEARFGDLPVSIGRAARLAFNDALRKVIGLDSEGKGASVPTSGSGATASGPDGAAKIA